MKANIMRIVAAIGRKTLVLFCLRPGSLGIGCFMTKGKVSPVENVQWSKACPVPGRGTLMELACT